MINHPAMPKIDFESTGETWENPSLRRMLTDIKQDGAELAFRSLVKWVEEHGCETQDGRFWLSKFVRLSLRKAAGLEKS